MTRQHNYDLDAWAQIQRYAGNDDDFAICLLELRDRLASLEANPKPTPNDRQIRSSLLERVAEGLMWSERSRVDACFAIREVAAWLREQGYNTLQAEALEQEAER